MTWCVRTNGAGRTAIASADKSVQRTADTLLVLCGVALAGAAVWQLRTTFRSGSFRARGGRDIRRARHPTMFWANAAGLVIAAALGLGLAVWAW
jgi:hypothetical protein